ncbi:MAG TPA: TolC family protein [Spirochaetales bacterium]|nr:TolC family protein [Spirochaetales bacterium]HPG85214.1 TolC family protein [Spirochaetales bacterium]HPM71472.1 TolC family protein [Spirochaetales bacterium]
MRTSQTLCAPVAAVALTLGACAGYYVDYRYATSVELDALASVRGYPETIIAGEPLGVAEAAAYAIANDQALSSDREALDLREGRWRLAFRSFLPSVTMGASADETLAAVGAESLSRSMSASIEQALWDGGRLAARRALESVELGLARLELERSTYETGEGAVASYRGVMTARARLEIQTAALDAARLSRAALASELGLGLASADELLEADLEIGDAEIALSQASLELSEAEGNLAYALGVDKLPPLADGGLGQRPELKLDADELWRHVVELSPELREARYRIVAKRAEARAAAAGWLPAIGLTASWRLSGDRFPLSSLSWSVGARVEFSGPLAKVGMGLETGGDGRRERNAANTLSAEPVPDPAGIMDIRSARLALRVEEEAYAAALRELRVRTMAATRAYEHSLARRRLCRDAARLASIRFDSVGLRRDLGRATTLEALRAGLERADAEIDLLEACASIVEAEREVERLIGLPPDGLCAFVEGL